MKIVVRRTDKAAKGGNHGHKGRETQVGHSHDSSKKDAFVGLVIAKADALVEDVLKAKKKPYRQNRFGEVKIFINSQNFL